MELIWLKLETELSRLWDTAERSKGVKGERRDMHQQERGAAWKGGLRWEPKPRCSHERETCINSVTVHVISSQSVSGSEKQRNFLFYIKMPLIFCLQLLIPESLGEQLPRHLWLKCFCETKSPNLQGEGGPGTLSVHSEPAGPTVEAIKRHEVLVPAWSNQTVTI